MSFIIYIIICILFVLVAKYIQLEIKYRQFKGISLLDFLLHFKSLQNTFRNKWISGDQPKLMKLSLGPGVPFVVATHPETAKVNLFSVPLRFSNYPHILIKHDLITNFGDRFTNPTVNTFQALLISILVSKQLTRCILDNSFQYWRLYQICAVLFAQRSQSTFEQRCFQQRWRLEASTLVMKQFILFFKGGSAMIWVRLSILMLSRNGFRISWDSLMSYWMNGRAYRSRLRCVIGYPCLPWMSWGKRWWVSTSIWSKAKNRPNTKAWSIWHRT